MMTTRVICGVVAAALCSLGAQAQQVDERTTTTYDTEYGQLTVHSGQPGPRTYAPPPPFDQLAQGKAYITTADAEAYDLLANDYIYADGNRDGRISRSEYERWARSPR